MPITATLSAAPVSQHRRPSAHSAPALHQRGGTPPSEHVCPQFADLVYGVFNAYRNRGGHQDSAYRPSTATAPAAATSASDVTRPARP
ncbi:uncharacterized protein LOC62_04G005580 [Vanrija pseudolonga]|uniref:Uncharacterized protein n=1 Tax=Vanrija pseudolonga TaxID=143232 RepID=A0AAF1BRE5_9TREE|nr:hypothetical protein LOC62_04G005580 [Vanrija pseudolonga]